MKNKKMLFFVAALLVLGVSACKKSTSDLIDATANYPKPPANYVKSQNLTGVLKGTLKQDSTYYIGCSAGRHHHRKGKLSISDFGNLIVSGNGGKTNHIYFKQYD
jgi:hypothetical protein